MHRLLAVLVIAAAIGTGCGGGDDEAAPRTTAAEPPRTQTVATDTQPARTIEEPGPTRTGKEIFIEAGCGDCHTLEAAGRTGTVGPNLDEHLAHHEGVEHIEMQIRQGGGGMPSFSGRLSDEEIRRLARFVHDATAP